MFKLNTSPTWSCKTVEDGLDKLRSWELEILQCEMPTNKNKSANNCNWQWLLGPRRKNFDIS